MTWTDIGHAVGEDLRHAPVEADPADFDRAADHFAAIEDAINDVAGSLRGLEGGGADFKGATADAFVAKLAVLRDDLEKVPVIAYQVKDIMRHHSYWLRDLEQDAERALSTARHRKTEFDAARNRESQAGTRLAAIERQIRDLEAREAAGDETVTYELTTARSEESRQSSQESGASRDVGYWTNEIRNSVGQFRETEQRETNLNKETVQKIHGIHFQGLHDPNAFERYVGRPAGEFFNDLGDFFIAAATGNFDEAMWKLDDMLATILTVVATAALIIAVVGLSATGVGAFLAAALFGLAIAKLASSSVLFASQSVNPETGETKSGWDVVGDMATVALATVGLHHARLAFWAKHASVSQLVASKPLGAVTYLRHFKRINLIEELWNTKELVCLAVPPPTPPRINGTPLDAGSLLGSGSAMLSPCR